MALAVALKPRAVATEGCGGGQLEGTVWPVGQDPVDLQGFLRLENRPGDAPLRMVEVAVEIAVGQMRGALMQTADEIKRTGADHDPRPVRDGEMLLHVLDLVMQQQRGDAESEAENGDAAERNRHAHHTLSPHRLEHEQAENAVHQIEQPSDILRRGEVAPACLEDRGGRGELGERKAGSPIKHPHTTQRIR